MGTELAPVDTETSDATPTKYGEHDKRRHLRQGGGRPKGAQNRLTKERHEFIDAVVGKVGSTERQLFALSIRTQFMAGTLSPVVAQTILYWWLGKPKETVEVQGELTVSRVVREIVDPGSVIDVDPVGETDVADGVH